MNVLSLFDGMSCGQIALERAGIKVDKYYASEIDKYAIQITQKNYPDTVQLGDVTKWCEWDLPKIDLILAGSPCQGFSFAGKQLAFDDPRSKLFFDFVDIKNHYEPDNYLLENVKMKQEFKDVISGLMGVEPTEINSSLVSAQNRRRDYWSDLEFGQPGDKGIMLFEILHIETENKYDAGDALCDGYSGGEQLNPSYKSQANTVHKDKSATLCAGTHGYSNGYVDKKYYLSEKAIAYINRGDRITKKFTAINGKKSLCLMSQYDQSKNGTFLCVDSNGRIDSQKTGFLPERYYKGVESYGSSPFLLEADSLRFRKFTPIECERLQTVPDNYTQGVSNTQRYKMLGNGWTVDVIAHILKGLVS